MVGSINWGGIKASQASTEAHWLPARINQNATLTSDAMASLFESGQQEQAPITQVGEGGLGPGLQEAASPPTASPMKAASATQDEPTMTLRGRLLKGLQCPLPDGYEGLTLVQDNAPSSTATSHPCHDGRDGDDMGDDDDEGGEGGAKENSSGQHLGSSGAARRGRGAGPSLPGKSWQATSSFSSVTIWGHDTAPTRSDPAKRCIDYLAVAAKVHLSLTRDQVLNKLQIMRAGDTQLPAGF